MLGQSTALITIRTYDPESLALGSVEVLGLLLQIVYSVLNSDILRRMLRRYRI